VLERNIFVERVLPGSVLRQLTDEEMDHYREPFREPGEARRPTLTWPREIPDELIRWEGEGPERRPIVLDVERWIDRASDELALFSELGAPWTKPSQRES